MKKGLNVTLMTVAIAVMAVQAMALAPVIDPIPSPIVGNETGSTQATPFIYPDAFNLDNLVADDTTADANILWSYTIVGTPIYRINNVDTVVVGTDNLEAPGAKRLNGATKDSGDVDGNSNTITIRNLKYTSNPGQGGTPSATGIIDSQVVTFFASDGTTHTPTGKSAIFYSDNGGNDRLSTGIVTYPVVFQPNFGVNTGGFTHDPLAIGTVTFSSDTGNTGICLEVPLLGNNFAGWQSAWGVLPITANTVYRLRVKVTGSQAAAGHTPFWDMVISNYNDAAAKGLNLFGGDHLFLDNEGGANAALTTPTGGKQFTWVWCPSPILNAAWNNTTTGLFTSTVGTNKDCEFKFRVLDLDATPGITANVDSGKLCLKEVTVEAIPYSSLQITQAWTLTSLSSSTWFVNPLLGSTVTYPSGTCQIKNPTSGGPEYAASYPGSAAPNYGNPASLTASFPIPWEASTLYQAVFDMSAPTTADENTPCDVFWVGLDAATNELINISFVTGNQNRCAMPKTGTPQKWMAFLYSHAESLSGVSQFHRLRPRAEFGNVDPLVFNPNTGSLTIHAVTVNKVVIP